MPKILIWYEEFVRLRRLAIDRVDFAFWALSDLHCIYKTVHDSTNSECRVAAWTFQAGEISWIVCWRVFWGLRLGGEVTSRLVW